MVYHDGLQRSVLVGEGEFGDLEVWTLGYAAAPGAAARGVGCASGAQAELSTFAAPRLGQWAFSFDLNAAPPATPAVLLVSHRRQEVTVVERAEGNWRETIARAGESLVVGALDLTLPVDALYAGIALDA